MSLPVVYLPDAQRDGDAASSAYEQRRVGLGDRFLEAVRDQADTISANPAL